MRFEFESRQSAISCAYSFRISLFFERLRGGRARRGESAANLNVQPARESNCHKKPRMKSVGAAGEIDKSKDEEGRQLSNAACAPERLPKSAAAATVIANSKAPPLTAN